MLREQNETHTAKASSDKAKEEEVTYHLSPPPPPAKSYSLYTKTYPFFLKLEELKDKYDKMGKDLVRLRAHLMEKEDVHNLELIEGEHRIEALQKKYVSLNGFLRNKD